MALSATESRPCRPYQRECQMKTTNELKLILEDHALWLASSASDGTRADLSGAQLDSVDLSDADLNGALLRGASLKGANLVNAQLAHADLSDALLQEADLSGSDLQMADFSGADLSRANLSNTTSSSGKELGKQLRGPRFRNAVLLGSSLQHSYCALSDFSGSQLRGADLRHAVLAGANLSTNDLSGISFQGAKLAGADLSNSILCEADLSGCELSATKFVGADLSRADVSDSNLQGANLADARVEGIRYDRKARFRGIRVASCYGSSRFRRFAQDQDYIEEFKEAHQGAYLLWLVTTDCGRSLSRVALWSFGLSLLFALIYLGLGEAAFSINNKETLGWNIFTTFYYSVVTFTTLGFGDITPHSPFAALIVMIEVVVGYVTLGILISILATKVARRS